MKGWRERAADIFTKQGEIAAKMKSAPGPVPSDCSENTPPCILHAYSTNGTRPEPHHSLIFGRGERGRYDKK